MNYKNYNGWSNYETCNLALWMDNEQGLYSLRCDAAHDIAKNNEDRNDANQILAAWLKSAIEDEQLLGELPESGFLADMINAALSEIDYYEIAEHWLYDIWDEHHAEATDEDA